MQETLERTLASLIAIPSESHNTEACHSIIEFVRNELEPLGLFMTAVMERDNPYLIATTQHTRSPKILLVAHLDVVPAHESQYTMTKVNEKLYGRGVFDMKFAAACFIEFAKKHRDQLKDFDIGFLFTTDEEIGGASVNEFLEDGWRTDIVFIPDGGDNWHIEERAKGFTLNELIASGKAAHGSRPWEGDNAFHTLIPLLHEIRERYPFTHEAGPTLTISVAQAGHAWNQVPDSALVAFDFRSFDDKEVDDHIAYLASLAKTHNLTLKTRVHGRALHLDKSSPLVHSYTRALEDTLGTPAEFGESYGASDGHWFARHNIPALLVQPNGGDRHGPNEWLLAHDLEKYYLALTKWLNQEL